MKTSRLTLKEGMLFHKFSRIPRRARAKQLDRLKNILEQGLLSQRQLGGMEFSDLAIEIDDPARDYHDLVYLHCYDKTPMIEVYLTQSPGDIIIFFKEGLPYMAPEAGGISLCENEVYVEARIGWEWFESIVLHANDAADIVAEFEQQLRQLSLTVYVNDGSPYWKP